MFNTEPTSGFAKDTDIVVNSDFTEFTNVRSNSFCQLTRAKRNGRWWMLKGLKEPYRQDSIYRLILQKEFEIASQLQHPMIVTVNSLEEVRGLGLCIVMEWIEGMTLGEWLHQKGHTRKQRHHIADMLLEVLTYVHSRQTQHRDLKPSNIIITNNGQYLKLIDFGLSDTDSHAVLKASAGTEGYMAPEGASDIYSLGCILREMHLGWTSRWVIRKCCAPLHRRYEDTATIKRDLHRCWFWPKRILFFVGIAVLVATLYLWSFTSSQQGLHSVRDSLKLIKEENKVNIENVQAKTDSFQFQMNTLRQQSQSEYAVIQQHQNEINAAKQQIDKQLQAYGIEQMLDTVSCQRNISIPFLRITDELIQKTEEPELKNYINEKYRKPWLKRVSELPFE